MLPAKKVKTFPRWDIILLGETDREVELLGYSRLPVFGRDDPFRLIGVERCCVDARVENAVLLDGENSIKVIEVLAEFRLAWICRRPRSRTVYHVDCKPINRSARVYPSTRVGVVIPHFSEISTSFQNLSIQTQLVVYSVQDVDERVTSPGNNHVRLQHIFTLRNSHDVSTWRVSGMKSFATITQVGTAPLRLEIDVPINYN